VDGPAKGEYHPPQEVRRLDRQVQQDPAAALADSILAAAVLQRHPTALAMLAICLGAVGNIDEATVALDSILEVSLEFSISFARKSYPYTNPEHLERFCDLLQATGLPE